MTAEIVNLRGARKRKARETAEIEAAASRSAHGVSKGERQRAKADRLLLDKRLDGLRRQGETDEG